MGQVLSLETGQFCDTTDLFLMLPLPSPKLQWENSGPSTWEPRFDYANDTLFTLGHLKDTHQHYEDPSTVKHLDSWNATTDGLGMLLNLVVAML